MKLSKLLILSTATLVSAISARAQTVAPIPTPMIITTAPYTISKPGYYQLGADLTVSATSGAIITINASNVTLDFAGHYISGPSDSTLVASGTLTGVFTSQQGNITIENGTLAFCTIGIQFYGNNSATSISVNLTAKNMLVTYCGQWGIYLAADNYSKVTDCTISNITGYTGDHFANNNSGIFLNLGNGNYFTRNTIVNVPSGNNLIGYGIYAYDSANNIARSS